MRKRVKMIYGFLCFLLCAGLSFGSVQAASADKIVNVSCNGGYVYALSNSVDLTSENVACQIDGVDCEIQETTPIVDADAGIRTICMIDASKSITTSDRKQIKSIIKSMISNMGDNEQMEIDSVGQERKVIQAMTDDKFNLYSSYEEITYEKQPTYIAEIVSDIITSVSQSIEADHCFYRMIIITDDYQDDLGSLSTSALLQSLTSAPLPIYTIGCLHEDNSEKLKNFYDFSSLTGGESFTLQDDVKIDDIVSQLNEFYQDTLIKAKVPEELQDGTTRKISFTITDEEGNSRKVSSTVLMEQSESAISTEIVTESDEISGDNIEDEVELTWLEKNRFPVIIGSIAGAIYLVSAAILLFLHYKKKNRGEMKKQKGIRPEVTVLTGKDLLPKYETKVPMEFMDIDEDYNKTVAITRESSVKTIKPEEKQNTKEFLHIKLKDVNNNRVFEKEVQDEIYIGRTPSKDGKKMILLDYDPSVSKLHCRIYVSGGKLYIEDLDSLNGTFLNGASLNQEVGLSEDDILDVGQVKLKVSIAQR